MKIRLIFYMLASIMLVTACATTQQKFSLVGSWTVLTLDGNNVLDNHKPVLHFNKDGSIAGSSGCNAFNGTYTTQENSLTLGPLAVTRRACIPGLDTQEIVFFKILDNAAQFSSDLNGDLIITTQDNAILRAARQ